MPHRVTTLSLTAALLLLAGTGCGEDDAPAATTVPSAEAAKAEFVSADDYHPSRFVDPTAIDHRWFPLSPGKMLEYKGSSVEDGERLRHAVEIIVTDLTKVIDGVPTVVVWELDYTEGELVETELALFAQDKDGHVWHLGQYPEEYEEGKLVATPAWVHGIKGATAGITIPADPQTGTPDFAQGFAPAPIKWIDRGVVHQTGQETCVKAGCYQDVAVIAEFEKTIPNAFQDKYYAPGVGVVRVGWHGKNDESKEELELVKHSTLSPREMAQVREQALELEDRAYRVSKDVWGQTPRAE